ncbi:MAG: hypothetical protein ETSY1_07040 [Candidatus Entotheonella factor]|uniref:Orc1-like AAA ATPase domain-containing protein n=1 Tax=Entotheonella factor TaxID=1429438 RepID=W4LU77_ENTF1|nr:MAG: hypothetical protein ETSY1_07040 [Candidatus Entotheonella factor]
MQNEERDRGKLKDLSSKAIANLGFDEPLGPEDKRLVQLNDVRGDFKEYNLLWQLGIREPDGPAETTLERHRLLFGGHQGCGKSTELLQLAQKLHRPDRYFVVFLDALKELDIHNLRYSDISLAQARALLLQLQNSGTDVPNVFLTPLETWFDERLRKRETTKDFALQITASAKAKSGVPLLFELFAQLQSAIKTNSTYKEEVRTVVRNTFSEFAEAFNTLINHAEDRISEAHLGKRVLFIVDGTDRLRSDDAEDFFINDVYQPQLINTNIIYCAPIILLTERSVRHSFESFRLPMIKVKEKGVHETLVQPMEKLRELVTNRVSPELFEDQLTIDYLIEYSGGHVRDLIRLLMYALREAQGQLITREMAGEAIRQLATDYRRLIEQDDYQLLVEIDCAPNDFAPISDKTRRMLYDLVLLEYNSYWWQSHPAVQTLPGYQRALAQSYPERAC